MLKGLGHNMYQQTTIDFDNMQKSWYITDPGTVVWVANMEMWLNQYENREEKLSQMKTWFMDEYQWDITEDELKQGCQWRKDFMYYLIKGAVQECAWTDPQCIPLRYYLELN